MTPSLHPFNAAVGNRRAAALFNKTLHSTASSRHVRFFYCALRIETLIISSGLSSPRVNFTFGKNRLSRSSDQDNQFYQTLNPVVAYYMNRLKIFKFASMCHLVAVLMLIGFLTSTGSSLGAEENDVSPEELERGMKLVDGDLSVATNQVERFYALGRAARNALRDGKVKEAEALATELLRLAPKYKNDWNYGNAIADANQVLGRIALSKGDVAEAKKRLLASAKSQGSPQLNSFGPDFGLARELAEKGERDTVIAFLDSVARFWANPSDRTEANSKRIASEHRKQLESWKQQLRAGEVPNHPKWR